MARENRSRENRSGAQGTVPPAALAELKRNPKIKQVHIDEQGGHHFNAYPQMVDIFESDGVTKSGKKKPTGKLLASGGRCVIASTVSREDALSEAPAESPTE